MVTELQYQILKALEAKSPSTSKEMGNLYPTLKMAISRPLKTMQMAGYITQQARQGKSSLWLITDKGRERAALPLVKEVPRSHKNAWETLGAEARALLHELSTGRPVYKRRGRPPCLEKPIKPVPWGAGIGELIKLGMVTRVEGDLRRERSVNRYSWEGIWGRFVINDTGRKVLELAPKEE